ncbi:MAG: RNA polymerase sigma factor [Lachnospiraceae bacterium]|nr:RNA polymerase sigma factor [Lachnospiraceae bacterium]
MQDEQAIMEIYNRHGDALYRLCYFFMGNPTDALDAVQNTLVRLMEYRGSFESEAHEKNWLLKVGANECKMMLRHWWRRIVSIDSVPETADWEEDYERNPVLQQVMELPPKYRVPIYMYYYEGYSVAEISKMLRIREATIRSQMKRGRKLLKDSLEESGVVQTGKT